MAKIADEAEAQRAAEKIAYEKKLHAHLSNITEQLYSLRCFETMTLPDGKPLAMRVPGGWIFYMTSGGGGLKLQVGEGGETEQVLGSSEPVVTQIFIPFDNEFQHGCESLQTWISGAEQ